MRLNGSMGCQSGRTRSSKRSRNQRAKVCVPRVSGGDGKHDEIDRMFLRYGHSDPAARRVAGLSGVGARYIGQNDMMRWLERGRSVPVCDVRDGRQLLVAFDAQRTMINASDKVSWFSRRLLLQYFAGRRKCQENVKCLSKSVGKRDRVANSIWRK